MRQPDPATVPTAAKAAVHSITHSASLRRPLEPTVKQNKNHELQTLNIPLYASFRLAYGNLPPTSIWVFHSVSGVDNTNLS